MLDIDSVHFCEQREELCILYLRTSIGWEISLARSDVAELKRVKGTSWNGTNKLAYYNIYSTLSKN